MESHFETDNGYQTDTDAEHAVDEEGEESGIGAEQPDGHFNLAEWEILAQRQREWMQATKREKPIILWEIYKEFGKMGENHNLRPAEWQEKEEYSVRSVVQEIYHKQVQEKHVLMKNESASQGNNQWIDLYQQALTAFISEDLTKEELQAVCNITEKWNGPKGLTAEKCEEVWAEVHEEFCRGDVEVLQDEDVQSMDFNSDIAGGSTFNDIHTVNASWRDYLGTAYANTDVAEGKGVPNMAVNHPRAKKGDPVELVTSDEGQACGKCSATVPFKKLGQYQADMIASRHLPENFTFTVDPSHMCLSAAMELLTFWHEQQKWLDQSGNLQPPSYGHAFPPKIARKRMCHSQEPCSSADAGSIDEDADVDTEYEGTSFRPLHSYESIGTSHTTSHPQKKIPKPCKVQHLWKPPILADANLADEDGDPDIPYEYPSYRPPVSLDHTMDAEGHGYNSTADEDQDSSGHTNLPVLKKQSKPKPSTIQNKELHLTAVLWDTSEYANSDSFESIPFTDDHTAIPGPSGNHWKNRKLKSVLKQISGVEQHGRSELQHRKHKEPKRKMSPRQQGAGSDDGRAGLSAEGPNIGGQWKSP
ncbi:hypothetical protein EDC04DRAFT_2607253 [Pisolithus marmoratus]|nr:hypothetical protein EDC04DRAFT_2607253 [Pisolithus marmoratus]